MSNYTKEAWLLYEAEKKWLKKQKLTPEEYHEKIKEIRERLKIGVKSL